MRDVVLSVSELAALINQTLEYAYPAVTVEGEVSSFKVSKGKYVFFDLKDDAALIGCFLTVYQLRQPLEDGMKVHVIAAPRLTPWGKFSLTVREVHPVGEGSLKRSFELLKASLQTEGLFDESRKRPLPRIPTRVGLIASAESAAYADFVKVLNHRWGGLEVQVADVQVQGAGAARQIQNALEYFNQLAQPVEVIVLVRGGGSLEDLAAFNEPSLVRAVAASRTPVMVGVGHEVDTSLCDLAADVRAATPSNAAELLVPDRRAVSGDATHRERFMLQAMQNRLATVRQQCRTDGLHMAMRLEHRVQTVGKQLQYAHAVLRQLDPMAVLGRGYSIVRADGVVVKGSASAIRSGQALTIETSQVIIQAGVHHVGKKDISAIA